MTADDNYYERLLYDGGKRGTENRKYKGMGRLCDYENESRTRSEKKSNKLGNR